MNSPLIIEFGWDTPWPEKEQRINDILTSELLNKHIFLIDCYPLENSLVNDFDSKFELFIADFKTKQELVMKRTRKYLIADIPNATSEILEGINSESDFHINLHMFIFYDFLESENNIDLVNNAIEFCERFDYDAAVKFDKGNILFLDGDGNTLVIA